MLKNCVAGWLLILNFHQFGPIGLVLIGIVNVHGMILLMDVAKVAYERFVVSCMFPTCPPVTIVAN